jgi:hypothetical protein
MTATMRDIMGWLDDAEAQWPSATHMLVALDNFDYENWPIYVDDASEKEGVDNTIQMLYDRGYKVDEVYNLLMPADPQLRERRAWNV